MVAGRIASENSFRLGEEVGYQVRFESKASSRTRILLMTEGLLLRRLLDDPELSGVDGVILDEFHERSLDLDLGLALLKEIQSGFRPDLKLVLMSATLDPAPLERYLPGAKVFRIPGRVFPVERRYLDTRDLPSAVGSVLPESGDVLVFLPGAYEIEKAVRELSEWTRREKLREFDVLPLYASLPEDRQREVFRETGRRKIICATNIAETSLTLPGIRAVVDSGLQKVMRMDPALGLDRLETLRVSRAAADQRAGRAGRVSAGVALRLWSAGEQEQLRHFETPEIHRVNLGKAILTLTEFGVRDFSAFDWFEKPKRSMLDFAREELLSLGFLDSSGAITADGRRALRLPLAPRIAAIVIESQKSSCAGFGARLGALLDSISKDERIRDEEGFLHRLNRLTPAEMRVARQIEGRDAIPELSMDHFSHYERVLIRTGASRICVSGRIPGRRRVRAREGVLPEVALLLSAIDQGDVIASSWVPLSKASLHEFASRKRRVFFDTDSGRVRAVEGVFFLDLELSPLTEAPVKREEAQAALTEHLLKNPEARLPDSPVLRRFLARMAFMNRVRGEAGEEPVGIPWEELVPVLVAGKTRLEEIEAGEVIRMIEGMLSRRDSERLHAFAPDKIEVPSGSWIPVEYDSDPPRLAVRLQEVFGWLDTPKIAEGRVALLLELLSPGFKPMQVTRDLKSFWASAYFEVKKELKARYPRHSWPEDPLTAKPEAKGRRRG